MGVKDFLMLLAALDYVVEQANWDTSKVRVKFVHALGEHIASVRAAKLGEPIFRFEVFVPIERLSGGEETREVVHVVPIENKNSGEPRKMPNGKKSSKPPWPSKGPVLTISDLKLVKELTELAARKHTRIELIKALWKMKESKRSTSSISMPAMITTALFFHVLITQGTFSGNNARKQVVESPSSYVKGGLGSISSLEQRPHK